MTSDWSRLFLKLGMACKEVDTNVEEEEKRAKRRPNLKLKRNGEKEKRRRLCSDEDENSNPEDSRFEMCDHFILICHIQIVIIVTVYHLILKNLLLHGGETVSRIKGLYS